MYNLCQNLFEILVVVTEKRCQSQNYKKKTCNIGGTVTDIELKKQLSKTSCTKQAANGLGNFGISDGGTIWVDEGCRGRFNVISKSILNAAYDILIKMQKKIIRLKPHLFYTYHNIRFC